MGAYLKFTLFFTSLLFTPLLQAEHYMFFSVENFWMNQEAVSPPLLRGEVLAKKMKLVFDTEVIEIEPEEGELFHAKVMMEENRLSFKKGYLSFSTDMGELNPLRGVESFKIINSDVEIAKDGITMNSHDLNMVMAGVQLGIKNASLICDTDGDYTTDIDDVCLKSSRLRKLKGGTGEPSLSVKDLNSDFPLDLTLFVKDLTVAEKSITATTHNISGKIFQTNYNLAEASFKCFKQPGQTDLDPEALLNGCFEESTSYFKNFSSNKKDLKSSIKNAHFNIERERFNLVSDSAKFFSGIDEEDQDQTDIEHLQIECAKIPVDNTDKAINIERNSILAGCLSHGNIRVAKVHMDEAKAMEFVKEHRPEIYKEILQREGSEKLNLLNFKDISIESRKGKFSLKAKAKLLFRVPVRISGSSILSKEDNLFSISVDKATVLGIPSRKLALYLVKKFVANEDIQVSDNVINISMK